jgi:hypothetical protein
MILQAQLVSEKYWFSSPAEKHPYKLTNSSNPNSKTSQRQQDIKVCMFVFSV